MGGTAGGPLAKDTTIPLVLSQLSVIFLTAPQSLASLADSCSCWLWAENGRHSPESAVLYLLDYVAGGPQIIDMNRKHVGPRRVPCGTLALTCLHSDSMFPTCTRIRRFVRNLDIRCRKKPGRPKVDTLFKGMVWSTLSKALLKFSSKICTMFPRESRAFHQL